MMGGVAPEERCLATARLSRCCADSKNDNAHCKQKNWMLVPEELSHVRRRNHAPDIPSETTGTSCLLNRAICNG